MGISPSASDDEVLEAHRHFMSTIGKPDPAYRAIKTRRGIKSSLANEAARTFPARSAKFQLLVKEQMARNGGDYDLAFANVSIDHPKLIRS